MQVRCGQFRPDWPEYLLYILGRFQQARELPGCFQRLVERPAVALLF
jgi:hypothetical protein